MDLGTTTLGMDWERDGHGGHFHTHDGETGKDYTRSEFLYGKLFVDYPGSTLIVEAPHMAPQGDFSLSQVYTQQELVEIARQADSFGVTILLFPAKQTVRAGQELCECDEVDKTLDANAIRRFTFNHPEIPLMRFDPWRDTSGDERRTAIRQDMSSRLNKMRKTAAYESDEAISFRDQVFPALLADPRYTDAVALHFPRPKVINKGRRDERTEYKNSQHMSVYVAVFDRDGKLRRNDRGEFTGIREVMALFWMHAFHGKGGVARSNLIHWGLGAKARARKIGRDRVLRAQFARAVKTMAQMMRDYGYANGL